MTDFVWPPSLRQSSVEWRPVSNSEAIESPLSGQYQTNSRPGDRWACTVRVEEATASERRRLLVLSSVLRGQTNRILIPDLAHQRAGSFPASELLSNSDFSAGTSGWNPSSAGSNPLLSVSDQVLRAKVVQGGFQFAAYQQPSIALQVPYVLRAFMRPVGGKGLQCFVSINDGINSISAAAGPIDASVYSVATLVALASPPTCLIDCTPGNAVAGDYFDASFSSFSRCFLADGAGNLIQRSNALGTSPWSVATGTSAGSNGTAGPDGTAGASAAQYLQESDTTNREHYTTQTFTLSSAAQDVCASASAHANVRSWFLLRLAEFSGSTYAYAWFNVSTGAIGSTSAGANWSNIRTFITPQGNGWFRCTIVARKTNAATSCGVILQSANADGSASYAGTALVVPILLWECTVWPSSVPTRQVTSTSAPVATQPSGLSQIYVKGAPASTNGLLLAGDHFEADKQLKRLIAPFDSDAAGLGVLQFEPSFPRPLTDNIPIIVQQPLCKMIMVSDPVETARPGNVSDFEFQFMQDLGQ